MPMDNHKNDVDIVCMLTVCLSTVDVNASVVILEFGLALRAAKVKVVAVAVALGSLVLTAIAALAAAFVSVSNLPLSTFKHDALENRLYLVDGSKYLLDNILISKLVRAKPTYILLKQRCPYVSTKSFESIWTVLCW